LDVGCGDLYFLELIDEKEFSSYIVGIDISEKALKKARERIRNFNVNADLICADCNYLPIRDNSFELVTLMSLLSLLGKSYFSAFKESYRVSRQNIGFNVTHRHEAIAAKIKKKDMKECKYGWVCKRNQEIFLSSERKISALLKDFEMEGSIDTWYATDNTHRMERKDDILVLARKVEKFKNA
jgi:SAM-dependent methyltransferase